MIFGSLLTGFGGCDIGAKEAGMELAFGLEIDPTLAEVANFNLDNHVRVGDILDANPKDFPKVDLLHMSPECTRASNAAPTDTESALDTSVATKLVEFIDVLEPKHISIENVIPYRNFKSFGILINALQSNGYLFDVAHVNSADFGVPQKRRRLIVRASQYLLPRIQPCSKTVGWRQAIEDLLPSLKQSEFAKFQLRSMKKWGKDGDILVHGGNASAGVVRSAEEPAFVITANSGRTLHRVRIGNDVKAIDVGCLARFQSFPDWYVMPSDRTLACKGIGNAVPPLMMQSLYSQFVDLN